MPKEGRFWKRKQLNGRTVSFYTIVPMESILYFGPLRRGRI
jgi:hypothetical protein